MEGQSTMIDPASARPVAVARSSFTNFPSFPAELRLKIMKDLFPEARRVKLAWDTDNMNWKTDATPPLNLAINVECRIEALKRYNLSFGFGAMAASIPVDFARDEVFLPYIPGTDLVLEILLPILTEHTTSFEKIQHLRIESTMFDQTLDDANSTLRALLQLDEIKTITVVDKCQLHKQPDADQTDYEVFAASLGHLCWEDTLDCILAALQTKFTRQRTIRILEAEDGFEPAFSMEMVDAAYESMKDSMPDLLPPRIILEKITDEGSNCEECAATQGDDLAAKVLRVSVQRANMRNRPLHQIALDSITVLIHGMAVDNANVASGAPSARHVHAIAAGSLAARFMAAITFQVPSDSDNSDDEDGDDNDNDGDDEDSNLGLEDGEEMIDHEEDNGSDKGPARQTDRRDGDDGDAGGYDGGNPQLDNSPGRKRSLESDDGSDEEPRKMARRS